MSHFFAQVNIARMIVPLDHPQMADFVNNTSRINAIAEKSPGFLWRWNEEEGSSDAVEIFEDPNLVVNMSVWKSRDLLIEFTYHSDHVAIYKRKNEWFSKMKSMHMACWYTDKMGITLAEAKERLDYLNEFGETPYAFTFKSKFTPEDAQRYLRKH